MSKPMAEPGPVLLAPGTIVVTSGGRYFAGLIAVIFDPLPAGRSTTGYGAFAIAPLLENPQCKCPESQAVQAWLSGH